MARSENRLDVDEQLPLRPIDLQMLIVLIDGNRHGYGLMKAVEEQSGGRVTLEVGSLYRVIKRLLAGGVIEEAGREPSSKGSRRRINYRITSFGREVAQAEVARLADVVAAASERNLLKDGKRA